MRGILLGIMLCILIGSEVLVGGRKKKNFFFSFVLK